MTTLCAKIGSLWPWLLKDLRRRIFPIFTLSVVTLGSVYIEVQFYSILVALRWPSRAIHHFLRREISYALTILSSVFGRVENPLDNRCKGEATEIFTFHTHARIAIGQGLAADFPEKSYLFQHFPSNHP